MKSSRECGPMRFEFKMMDGKSNNDDQQLFAWNDIKHI